MPYDRDELLARVDLEALFLELVGPGRGRGRSATWPCPEPSHEQTGRTPPVSLDSDRGLWRCHACGAGGSAVDLVMLSQQFSVGEAMAMLAQRVGLAPESAQPATGKATNRKRSAPAPLPPRPAPRKSAAIEAHVAACEKVLWAPEGAKVLAWLRGRGWSDAVLRSARVGADPGPDKLARAEGLPRKGPGALFPVLGADGQATYCQLRYLQPSRGRKYDNPIEAKHGPNPRLAVLPSPTGDHPSDLVVVCEGLPDALSALQSGFRAAAVLGAGYPDEGVATQLVAAFPSEELVVAFDVDERGRAGAAILGEALAGAGAGRRVRHLAIPGGEQGPADLNAWAIQAGDRFTSELRQAIQDATPLGWRPVPSAADLLAQFFATQADVEGAVRIPSGIVALDNLLAHGGWRPGVVLLGGMPGVGKSAFALHTSLHAAAAGHPVVYVSVEQGPFELLGRLFCKELGRGIADYWNREPAYLAGAREAASSLPLERLYLRADPAAPLDNQGTVDRVRQWATEVAEITGQVPLVVVDYLQRMRPPEADRRLDDHRQLSLAGLGLRQLARDLTCPVVAISSVNRQSYDKAPSLDAFKGSGDLEYDADSCLLLRVAARSDEEAKAITTSQAVIPVELHIVGKNRYGPLTGAEPILLDFDQGHGGFHEQRRLVPTSSPAVAGNGPVPNPPPLL